MRISDWSSDVCSSDLFQAGIAEPPVADEADAADTGERTFIDLEDQVDAVLLELDNLRLDRCGKAAGPPVDLLDALGIGLHLGAGIDLPWLQLQFAAQLRSEEHTSELQSLMRLSSAVFCLEKKKKTNTYT